MNSAEDPKYAQRKNYNKLVRDLVPEHIEKLGKPLAYHIAGDSEYRQALWAKLDEELAELKAEASITELGDLLEVLYALADELGIERGELERHRAQRAIDRGEYKKRIILEWS